jgi:hypothetical protein
LKTFQFSDDLFVYGDVLEHGNNAQNLIANHNRSVVGDDADLEQIYPLADLGPSGL